MKTEITILKKLVGWAAVAVLGCAPLGALQAQDKQTQGVAKRSDEPPAGTQGRVRFRPPAGGAASARLTGGSRGIGQQNIRLDVLTPDGVGLTTQPQPSLFWYQSEPTEAAFELTLLQDDEPEPLIKVNVKKSVKAGIQRLRLADHDVKLDPDVEYQWVVALITDPENRSSDLVASGVVKRIAPTPELKSRVETATKEDLAAVYAEAGIWYDSLAALTDRIEAHPDDAELANARTDLLQQVGLKVATNQ